MHTNMLHLSAAIKEKITDMSHIITSPDTKNRTLATKPDYFLENNLESDSSPVNWTRVEALVVLNTTNTSSGKITYIFGQVILK